MKWYVAEIIVYCRVRKSSKGKSLYDRQVKVLRASSHEAAYQRALELGREENHSYKNSEDEIVFWQFAGLGNLEELLDENIIDGTEVFSRLQRGNPKSEIRRKRDLTIFWADRNKRKPAGKLLNSFAKHSAPR